MNEINFIDDQTAWKHDVCLDFSTLVDEMSLSNENIYLKKNITINLISNSNMQNTNKLF